MYNSSKFQCQLSFIWHLNLIEVCEWMNFCANKGNNKITELRTILQRESQNSYCENRNDPDLVQAFLKKWWVESDFKAPNLPLIS